MKRDDLHGPLGLGEARLNEPGRRRAAFAFLVGGALIAAAGAVFVVISHEPADPGASALIVRAPVVAKKAQSPQPTAGPRMERLGSNGEQVETESGVRVIRAGVGPSSSGVLIHVPQAVTASKVDPGLVEKSRFGLLPKVGADGARPSVAYRRSAPPGGLGPRVALLIGGMGLDEAETRTAVQVLPPEVTLGFATLAKDLPAQTARAREAGHEVLLQTPMQALAVDTSEPLAHELTVEAGAARNRDNLRWDMGRFTGYFGIMNYMGSKLTANRAALKPILQEVERRGLAYVDDGSSPLSLAPQMALELGIPTIRADVVIDAGGSPDALAGALHRLKEAARARGFALGVGSGLPATVDSVADFARALKSDGFSLVPVSSLLVTEAATLAQSAQ